jgi:hypothetical protein
MHWLGHPWFGIKIGMINGFMKIKEMEDTFSSI